MEPERGTGPEVVRAGPLAEGALPARADLSPATPASHGAHDDHGGHGEHARYPFLAHHFDTPEHQFETGKLGIWIFLVTEVLFFSGLFCAYTIYRGQHPEIFVWAHYYLDTNLGALNTAVLLFSSLTAAWAVRNAQLGQQRALVINIALTIACAFTFMGVKYIEYNHKFHDGLLWGGRPTLDGKPPQFRFDPHEPVWELEGFRHHHPEAAAAAARLHAVNGAEHGEPDAAHASGQPRATMAPSGTASATPSPAASAAPAALASAARTMPVASASATVLRDAEVLPAPATAPDSAAPSASAVPVVPPRGHAPAEPAESSTALPADDTAALDAASSGAVAASPAPPPAIGVGAPGTPSATAAATPAAHVSAAAAPAAGAAPGAALAGAPVLVANSGNPLAGLTDLELVPLLRAGVLGPRAIDPSVPSRPKNAHVFFGIYFFMTGLHGIHVVGGIVVWVWLLVRALRGQFGPKYFGPIDFAALYWHLVDLVWIYLFPLLYLIH